MKNLEQNSDSMIECDIKPPDTFPSFLPMETKPPN